MSNSNDSLDILRPSLENKVAMHQQQQKAAHDQHTRHCSFVVNHLCGESAGEGVKLKEWTELGERHGCSGFGNSAL